MTGTTEAGWYRPQYCRLTESGEVQLSPIEAYRPVEDIVQRFERGETDYPQASREMAAILRRLPDRGESSPGIQSLLRRWQVATTDRARQATGSDRVEPAPTRSGQSAAQALPQRLQVLHRLDLNRAALDECVSRLFERPLQTFRGMDRADLERQVRAAGFDAERTAEITEAIERRIGAAFARELSGFVTQRLDRLATDLARPSRHAIGDFVSQLSGDAREATLRGFEALGMSQENRACIAELCPPADDQEMRALEQALRAGLAECASAVREERDAILEGGTLDEMRTGDLVRLFPRAAQQVASRLGLNRESARIDGVHAGSDRDLIEEAVAQHVRSTQMAHRWNEVAEVVLGKAVDLAAAAVLQGLVGTVVGVGKSSIEVENQRRLARTAEASFQAGMGSDLGARTEAARTDALEADRAAGIATGVAGPIADATDGVLNEVVEGLGGVADFVGPPPDRRGPDRRGYRMPVRRGDR